MTAQVLCVRVLYLSVCVLCVCCVCVCVSGERTAQGSVPLERGRRLTDGDFVAIDAALIFELVGLGRGLYTGGRPLSFSRPDQTQPTKTHATMKKRSTVLINLQRRQARSCFNLLGINTRT